MDATVIFLLRVAWGACVVLMRRVVRGPLRPSWSLRTELLRMSLREGLDGSVRWGVHWLRGLEAAAPAGGPALEAVRFEPVAADGVTAQWCTPRAQVAEGRTIVYLHGGGYVIGSVGTHRELIARLAVAARARVLGVDYRLAPEHPLPAAQDDALCAYHWLVKQGTDPARIVLAGDSAGAALCLATLLSLRERGQTMPAAAALISPWTDPLRSGGTIESHARFDVGDRSFLVNCAALALAGGDANDPKVAAVRADLSGLPPMIVHAGGAEMLLDQIVELCERAEKAGVSVELRVFDDMFHDFHLHGRLMPEARAALEALGTSLDRLLG